MLLLSCFHIHSIPSNVIDCKDCVEHVHHAGHITQFSAHEDECAMCRFMSQRFVAELQPQELKNYAIVVAVVVEPVTEAVIDTQYGPQSLRSPPAIL